MLYGFRQLKWYGLSQIGLMGNNKLGRNILSVLSSYDGPPAIEKFYENKVSPHKEDEVVELRLVAKKIN